MEAQPMNSPTQQHAGGAVAGTNVMAILALVFAFIFAPLGIVFGAVAKHPGGLPDDGVTGSAPRR